MKYLRRRASLGLTDGKSLSRVKRLSLSGPSPPDVDNPPKKIKPILMMRAHAFRLACEILTQGVAYKLLSYKQLCKSR
jgi:hypothetical protein